MKFIEELKTGRMAMESVFAQVINAETFAQCAQYIHIYPDGVAPAREDRETWWDVDAIENEQHYPAWLTTQGSLPEAANMYIAWPIQSSQIGDCLLQGMQNNVTGVETREIGGQDYLLIPSLTLREIAQANPSLVESIRTSIGEEHNIFASC